MAATATQNPVVKTESKSAKKKRAKATSTETELAPPVAAELAPSNAATESNNGDGSYESPYIKELYKSIRNVNKKITNASKVDGIVADNPGKTLDELVVARKINADQKAQILKKPSLQASLAQLEEQVAQYTKFDQEYKARSQAEKAEFEKTLTDRATKELEEAVAAAKAEAKSTAEAEQTANLLLLSQFLKLAAIRRSEDETAELEESKALEGLLAQVYGGDLSAVAAMVSLIQGSSKNVASVTGESLNVTFADLKAAAEAQISTAVVIEETEPVEETSVDSAEYTVTTDPTITNAGLTEIDEPVTVALTNGHPESTLENPGHPQNTGFGDGSANAAAEGNWDNNNELSASQEWVEVPSDAAETDTGLSATPAAPSNVQSWADDQPDTPTDATSTPPANPNDGFQEIQRNRGRGGFRGDGYRGGGRGRGGDGHHPRGRGGFRGDGYRGNRGRGGGNNSRGGRRPEESS